VIQAILRELPDTSNVGAKFPLPAEVAITPEGVVSLLRRPSGEPGLVAAGRLLGDMLRTDVPVRLRLIHSEAVATTPAFHSLNDLSAALAYFERPDAQQSIQQLYARASAKPARQDAAPASVAPASLSIAPPVLTTATAPELVDLEDFLPETPTPPPPPPPPVSVPRPEPHLSLVKPEAIPQQFQQAPPVEKERKPQAGWIAVAAVVGLVVVSTGAFLLSEWEQAAPSEPVENPSTAAPELESAKSTPARQATKQSAERQPPKAREAGRPEVRIPVPTSRDTSGTNGRADARLSTMTAELPMLTANRPDILLPDFSWTTRLPLLGRQPFERVSSLPTATDSNGELVFSRANSDVKPPIAIRPHLPSEPPMDYPPDHLMVLDLVVTPKGEVESVRLMTVPRTINDFMIVSAAKAWLFAPAKLNGRAVKYKHRIRFVVP
jgi:hypothetical protein